MTSPTIRCSEFVQRRWLVPDPAAQHPGVELLTDEHLRQTVRQNIDRNVGPATGREWFELVDELQDLHRLLGVELDRRGRDHGQLGIVRVVAGLGQGILDAGEVNRLGEDGDRLLVDLGLPLAAALEDVKRAFKQRARHCS